MIIEKLLAGVVLAICVILVVRLCLGVRRRQRFDSAVRRAAQACQRSARASYHWLVHRKNASRAANDAIKRARGGSWDGNVYKPKSFRRPRKPH